MAASKGFTNSLEKLREQYENKQRTEGPKEVVSSGILALDRALRKGGIPRGCIVDLFGDETLGKTTIALTMMAARIRNGERCAYIDAEHKLNPDLVNIVIPNKELFHSFRPKDGDAALALLESFVKMNEFKMVAVDSMAAIVPSEMLEEDANPNRPGLAANRITTALKRILTPVDDNDMIVITINQMRANMSFFARGSGKVPTSINALKFLASIRIQLNSEGLIRENDEAIGQKVGVGVIKNNFAAPFGKASLTIIYGKGIDANRDLVDCGVALDVIQKNGGWFSYMDEGKKGDPIEIKAHGEAELLEKLTPIMDKVRAKIHASMQFKKEQPSADAGTPEPTE